MAESGGGDGGGENAGGRRRIPVVYYLSRNRHLEHPHFIEVPLCSPDAFFLRDFIERLNQVRGKGVATMYSWSCKRSYKNGFVWHDLSEDDLILPSNGNEYVLKGSEILDPSPPDQPSLISTNPKPSNQTRPKQDAKNLSQHKSKESSPSSSASPPPISNKNSKPLSPPSLSTSRDEEQSPSSTSSEHRSSCQLEMKFQKPVPLTDACTQTEEETVAKPHSIPTDDNGLLYTEATINNRTSSFGKSETLESLIRAEGRTINQLRVLEEDEEVVFTSGPRLSPASYLMHLISCGSISVKDHRQYGFIPIYRPSYVQVAVPSPFYGTSSMRFVTRMEDKEYFSGSIVETKRHIEDAVGDTVPVLKRSSSYNAERNYRSSEQWKDETETDDSSRSRCLPRAMKMITSPLSDCPRSSSSGPDVSQTPPTRSRRIITKALPVVEPSRRKREKKEKLFKIEERLASGARVIIQSRVPYDESENASDT